MSVDWDPGLDEETIAAFETKHGVRLPRSYRDYLMVSAGGALGLFLKAGSGRRVLGDYFLLELGSGAIRYWDHERDEWDAEASHLELVVSSIDDVLSRLPVARS